MSKILDLVSMAVLILGTLAIVGMVIAAIHDKPIVIERSWE